MTEEELEQFASVDAQSTESAPADEGENTEEVAATIDEPSFEGKDDHN